MVELNIELLDRTLAHIEAHPDEWEQTNWRCRSAACFAGTAALLAGGRWLVPSNNKPTQTFFWWQDVCLVPEPDDPREDVTVGLDAGSGVHVMHRAERVLGLSPLQAEELFGATNTLDDLRRIVADLKAGS